MRYNSKEESQIDHTKNYRSDGVKKGKGTIYSADYLRVMYIIESVPKNCYVLDVGCNSGAISIPLQKIGNYVKAIDLVPELVSQAQKNGIKAEVGEAEDLSRFENNTFDCVICSEVLEHLYDPLVAIKEAYRVLKPGGKYIVTVPYPDGEMSKNKLGDFHQQNFSLEIIDTLFHNVFERGKVIIDYIPYIQEYCYANNIKINDPQWIGLVAIK